MAAPKTSRRQHDSPKKNRLIGIITGGKTIAEAAKLSEIPYPTAKKIWQKYQQHGSTSNLPRSGRRTIVTDRMKRFIVREATKARRKPFAEIGNLMDPKVSEGTVRNVLADAGYHRRVAKKVPWLTSHHRSARRHWVKLYKKYGRDRWGQVIWSDESYIHLGDNRGRIFVTRRANEELHDDCLVPSFKQSSVRVMVWGCIMRGRKGPLVVLEYPGGKGGGMNSKRYQEQVLEGVLRDFYDEMKAERGRVIFQQDGAASHTSKSTMAWFSRENIPLLFHPPNSPDLNPIEPVWHELKQLIRALPHPPNTVEQLKAAIRKAWDDLKIEDIDKHVKSMPERVRAVAKARGGHTRY